MSPFDPIEEAIRTIAAGGIVVVADDENRENEGDLIMAADAATPEAIAFFVRHTSGVICAALTGADCERLELPLMVPPAQNADQFRTAFTVTVDLAHGTTTGIVLQNFNALDLWVWSSLFEDCGVGITNDPGAGNYRVYGSVFRRSRTADLYLQNTGGFTARGNYSTGSRAFWMSGQAINHPSTVDIENNTIVDAESPMVIRIGNQGPGLLLGNRIRSLPNTAGPVVRWTSLFGADLVSVANVFTVAGAVAANGRLLTADDRIVTRDGVDTSEPVLPGAQPLEARRVYEVAPGANKIEVKRAIEQLLGAKVESVRTALMHGKFKRQGRYAGQRPDWKKAYVTLRDGQKIPEFLEGA